MIIVKIIGGLGNQMFQYAAGRSLAERLQTQLKMDIFSFQNYKLRTYSLSAFNISESFAGKKDIQCLKRPRNPIKNFFTSVHCFVSGNPMLMYKREPHFHFDPSFLEWGDNAYLDGYWQSEKYFKNIKDIIRQEFTLKKKPDAINIQMAEKMKESDGVSIHIRRGDYIVNPVTFNHHGVCPLEYYHLAIDRMMKIIPDPHFYIFSDDPLWVKQNLIVNYPHTYVTYNQNFQDYLDLWLMSKCKHHIIANSSFSWWGAWLSDKPDKIVIVPKKWVRTPGLDTRDLIPGSWQSV
jgi:hypothetical protein